MNWRAIRRKPRPNWWRGDPQWREVTLFAVGILAQTDGYCAADLVRALVHTAPETTEPLLHGALRLGLACLAQTPTLPHDLAHELLLLLVHYLAHQPFEPLTETFEEVAEALPHFKPNPVLVKALKSLIEGSFCATVVLVLIFRWLANVAPTNAEALALCQRSKEIVCEEETPLSIALVRFYATVGVVRAGEISGPNLALLVWHNRPIGFIGEVVELLGIGPTCDELTSAEKARLLGQFAPSQTLRSPSQRPNRMPKRRVP